MYRGVEVGDQNRAITLRPVRPRCKLWLDRVRRGNSLSSSNANICGGSFHPRDGSCNNRLRLSLYPRFPPQRFLRNISIIFDDWPVMISTVGKKKKGRIEEEEEERLVREKGRVGERDISWRGITVEFRLISMEAFSFSSDRLARRIVERTGNER